MSYTVSDQANAGTGKVEYIVVDCNGDKAPPPHGGPFSSKEEADVHCEVMKALSIEDWIAAYPQRTKTEYLKHAECIGRVLHISPGGRWIQSGGRDTFTVHPPTDFPLEIGKMVEVDKSGEIELLDRGPREGRGR